MQLEVGMIVEGKVSGITNFGAFVDLPEGGTGMVHISEIAPTFVKEIRDFVKEGQQVKVKVLSIGEKGKISLSIKQAAADEQPKSRQQRSSHRAHTPPAPVTSPGDFEWQSQKKDTPMSFEDMMSKFKQTSEDRMSDLKTNSDRGYSRRGGRR